jgi:glutathione S-transferase
VSETITLYSFGDDDRSGKVRWVAAELGLDVIENRVKPGAHRAAPYTDGNPFAQIPTTEFRGQTLIESTSTCQSIAEAFDEPRLWIGPREPSRAEYLVWLSTFAETLEGRLVECAVSRAGILGPEYFALHEKVLRFKLAIVAKRLPARGYLCGEHFTVADVVAGYSLRLAVQCELVDRGALEPYLGRLVAREGARLSRVFASL